MTDGLEHLVAGTYMDRSIADFARACGVYIEEELAKLASDTHLIALLCDAVRLTREMTILSQYPTMWPGHLGAIVALKTIRASEEVSPPQTLDANPFFSL